MSDSIMDIESGIDKIEAMIKSLRDERDKAVSDAAAAKRALDDREMELLQSDEELQQTKRRCEEKLAEEKKAREDIEARLAEVASKVKNLLPLVTEYSPEDRT